MKSCRFRWALPRPMIILAGLALAAPASAGLAQDKPAAKPESSAAAAKPHDVSGVVVRPPPKTRRIPPEKRAAFDAEAANRKAWTTYRATAPTPSGRKPHGGPVQTENYPGLHKLGSR